MIFKSCQQIDKYAEELRLKNSLQVKCYCISADRTYMGENASIWQHLLVATWRQVETSGLAHFQPFVHEFGPSQVNEWPMVADGGRSEECFTRDHLLVCPGCLQPLFPACLLRRHICHDVLTAIDASLDHLPWHNLTRFNMI